MPVPEVLPVERRGSVSYVEHLPQVAAVGVIIVGVVVFAGWALDIPGLRGIGDTAQMMPSTALESSGLT